MGRSPLRALAAQTPFGAPIEVRPWEERTGTPASCAPPAGLRFRRAGDAAGAHPRPRRQILCRATWCTVSVWLPLTHRRPSMTQATLQAEHNASVAKLCIALELGGTRWKLVASSGGTKITETSVPAGDIEGLEQKIRAARARHGLPSEAPVVSCYEAGRDGFWV